MQVEWVRLVVWQEGQGPSDRGMWAAPEGTDGEKPAKRRSILPLAAFRPKCLCLGAGKPLQACPPCPSPAGSRYGGGREAQETGLQGASGFGHTSTGKPAAS